MEISKIPLKKIDGKCFLDKNKISFDCSIKNARIAFTVATTRPYELNQNLINKIDKLIIKTIKLYKELKFSVLNCIQYIRVLEEYGYSYNKDFYLDKIAQELIKYHKFSVENEKVFKGQKESLFDFMARIVKQYGKPDELKIISEKYIEKRNKEIEKEYKDPYFPAQLLYMADMKNKINKENNEKDF